MDKSQASLKLSFSGSPTKFDEAKAPRQNIPSRLVNISIHLWNTAFERLSLLNPVTL